MARPTDPQEVVHELISDEQVTWLGIRHFSGGCAAMVEHYLRKERPDTLLVELPESTEPFLKTVSHPNTSPPVAFLTTWVDKRGKVFGSAPGQIVTYRSWIPLVVNSPEWVALRVAAELNISVRCIDAGLKAKLLESSTPQSEEVVSAQTLAESRYATELVRKSRRTTFNSWWEAHLEPTFREPTVGRRALLLYAACSRLYAVGDLANSDDLTNIRERHMAYHIREAKKAGTVAVVAGAYHIAALPWVRAKRAVRDDTQSATQLCRLSERALHNLYAMGEFPGWKRRKYHSQEPHRCLQEVAVEVVAAARRQGTLSGTEDALVATKSALHLATIRGGEVTRGDLVQAMVSAMGRPGDELVVHKAIETVLIGSCVGQLPKGFVGLPLTDDAHRLAKALRVPTDGTERTLRVDPAKTDLHKRKSAFLHQSRLLELGLVRDYAGPDVTKIGPVRRTESFVICWDESVEEGLLRVAHLGATLQEAAWAKVIGRLSEQAVLLEVITALVDAQRCGLEEGFLHLVDVWLPQMAVNQGSFESLVAAVIQLRSVALQRPDVAKLLFEREAFVLGAARTRLSGVGRDHTADHRRTAQAITDFVRLEHPVSEHTQVTLSTLVQQSRVHPLISGCVAGILVNMGRLTATQVRHRIGTESPEQLAVLGLWLEGLFMTARTLLWTRPELLVTISHLLSRLPEPHFMAILPDLRRAFSAFLPTEQARLAQELVQTKTQEKEDISTLTRLRLAGLWAEEWLADPPA